MGRQPDSECQGLHGCDPARYPPAPRQRGIDHDHGPPDHHAAGLAAESRRRLSARAAGHVRRHQPSADCGRTSVRHLARRSAVHVCGFCRSVRGTAGSLRHHAYLCRPADFRPPRASGKRLHRRRRCRNAVARGSGHQRQPAGNRAAGRRHHRARLRRPTPDRKREPPANQWSRCRQSPAQRGHAEDPDRWRARAAGCARCT